MKSRVSITGLKEIDGLFKKLPDEVSEKLLTAAHREAAKVLLTKAQELVPVDKGDLKESLVIVTESKGLNKGTVYVGPKKIKGFAGWRAHFSEFGTSKMAATPFMRPAFNAVKEEMVNIIKLRVSKRILNLMRKTLRKAK